MSFITFPESVIGKKYSLGIVCHSNEAIVIQKDSIEYHKRDKSDIHLKLFFDKSFVFEVEIPGVGVTVTVKDTDTVVDTIDLNSGGARWEGPVYDNGPFGYGNYYDENGNLFYSGFMINDLCILYGNIYYPNTNQIMYSGTHLNQEYQGYGILYNLHGEIVEEREWLKGVKLINEPIAISELSDLNTLHSHLNEIIIGDDLFNTEDISNIFIFHFSCKRIVIGDNSFSKVKVFQVRHCDELETLEIGSNSFTYYEESPVFSVTQCHKLHSAVFHQNSCCFMILAISCMLFFKMSNSL